MYYVVDFFVDEVDLLVGYVKFEYDVWMGVEKCW